MKSQGDSPGADAPSADDCARPSRVQAECDAVDVDKTRPTGESGRTSGRERSDIGPGGKVASLCAALLARKSAAAPEFPTKDAAARTPRGRERRASLTLRLALPDFLRLKLAAGLFERTSQSILLEALRAYLDAEGVQKFEDRPRLAKAADEPRGANGG